MKTKNILIIVTVIIWLIGVLLVGLENWKILIGVSFLMWADNLSKIIKKY